MKLIIHDLEEKEFQSVFTKLNDDFKVITNDSPIHNCIGCFGCWVKTPGACVIRDQYGDMGEIISKSDEVIVISRCCYGSFSPYVKNVLDRSISYVHPYFTIRKGEMHHKSRYSKQIAFTVWFYGDDITQDEITTAKKLVEANGINLNVSKTLVKFYNKVEEMEGLL
jgi:multimeric flavodoxin WrbA